MDHVNRFHTNDSWRWVCAEQMALAAALAVLLTLHAREVNWERFIAAFAVIDIAGYVPGAIAFRRAGGRPIHPIYHHLYNLTHNYLIAAAVAGIWAIGAGGFEWAMLALPIHLSGDRGLFGNTYKPVSLPFEPTMPRAEGIHQIAQIREAKG
jgi:hypothetical protein